MKKFYLLLSLFACICTTHAQNAPHRVISFYEELSGSSNGNRSEWDDDVPWWPLHPDSLFLLYDLDSLTSSFTLTGFYPVENLRNRRLGSEFLRDIVIPDSLEYDGVFYPVTSIADSAFYKCVNLTGVSLPNTVTYVGSAAFFNCPNIRTPIYNDHVFAYLPPQYQGHYSVPEGIEFIAGYAFAFSNLLTSISIPNSVKEVDVNAFAYCSQLLPAVHNDHFFAYLSAGYMGDYEIPEGITTIGDGAFRGGRFLTSITIPNTVTTIGKQAFAFCGIDTIILPENVRSIGERAFWACEHLSTIVFPQHLDSIGELAFGCCSALQHITIPEGVKTIPRYAFFECEKLKSVEFPASLRTIEENAFYRCFDIDSLYFPEGITHIGQSAFFMSYSIKKMHWPSSLTSVSKDAFHYHVLKYFTIDSSNPVYYMANGMLCTRDGKVQSCLDLEGDITVPDGIEEIEQSAFSYCEKITSVTFPSSVRAIGANAFERCEKLKNVNFPDSLESIGEEAFAYFNNLRTVHIPAGVRYIGKHAFGKNKKLTSFTVDVSNPCYCTVDGVLYSKDTTEIICCPNGKKGTLFIPKQVTKIAPYVIQWNNDYIKKIVVDSKNPSFCVLDDILYTKDLSRLIVCPNGKRGRIKLPIGHIRSIDPFAFVDCKYITYIWIPSTGIDVGRGAFVGCDRLVVHASRYFQYSSNNLYGGKKVIYE